MSDTRARLRPAIFLAPDFLSARLGCDLTLVTETFQHTGSFKFRAAYNLAANVTEGELIAASSGNFGQALARATSILGKKCTIVMPHNSARVKVEAVEAYGGTVDLIDTGRKSRSSRVAELALANPAARVASAYDDDLVIEGNSTLGEEVGLHDPAFAVVVVPVGGGGLAAGVLSGLRRVGASAAVVGAEPLLANDAARSLRAGRLIADREESRTIADGARTLSLGRRNWEILQGALSTIVEVPDETISLAVKLLFALANLKAEPTGALALAAVLACPERFAGRRVCCLVSGGNVDPRLYADLVGGGD